MGQRALASPQFSMILVLSMRSQSHPVVYGLLQHPSTRLSHFSCDGLRLVSACELGPPQLQARRSGARIALLEGHSRRIVCITFSPDGSTLASVSWNRSVRLWDGMTRTCIAVLRDHVPDLLIQ